jgi:hypothetical protein
MQATDDTGTVWVDPEDSTLSCRTLGRIDYAGVLVALVDWLAAVYFCSVFV